MLWKLCWLDELPVDVVVSTTSREMRRAQSSLPAGPQKKPLPVPSQNSVVSPLSGSELGCLNR